MTATITTRSITDSTQSLSEQQFTDNEEARGAFERMRVRAQEHGGSAYLVVDGERVASFSHFAENE